MNPRRLEALLRDVRDGKVSVERAREALKSLPFEDLGMARVDHHRQLRCGHPEVVRVRAHRLRQPQHAARREHARAQPAATATPTSGLHADDSGYDTGFR